MPYPYKAMLSITSDIDSTDTIEQFEAIQKLMVDQIGIKFSNTFLPFRECNKFSLLSGSLKDRDTIIENIHSGAIDAIHSFGDKQDFCRKDAIEVLKLLNCNNIKIKTWIDHAESTSNLCKYRFSGRGDVFNSKEYHFDLLKEFGIRYVWTERLSNIIGQGVPLKLKGILRIFDKRIKRATSKQLLKTFLKASLGFCGSKKYNFFKKNSLIFLRTMMDKNEIYEFVRFNNHFNGASIGDTFQDLWYLISKEVLETLKIINGYCVVYTHLGKKFDTTSSNGLKTINALYNLRKEYDEKNIMLSTVTNLLDYLTLLNNLRWDWVEKSNGTDIYIRGIEDPISGFRVPMVDDLKGVCFYVEGAPRVYIGNQEIMSIIRNREDHTHRPSITIQ